VSFIGIQYALFFIAVFSVYWILGRRLQNLWLLAASYGFYAAWDWRFLGLIVLSTVVDFIAGRRIDGSGSVLARRGWLALSLSVNLGILGLFKYANFFLASLQDLANAVGWNLSAPVLDIILPVGISFYTFQTLSYTLDIYLGRLKPTDSILDFAAFVAFFPQLVAGPIVRAREFLFQLDAPRTFNYGMFEQGLGRFAAGFFKKAIIADNLALMIVDPVFASPASYGTFSLWVAALAYAAQIYADFSGYSSMAIGSAAMLGFTLPENFRFPYLAKDFSDFWRRWHITMSRFFRDYVYIPLGGSRGTAVRTRTNLAATTLVSGLWHGASWTFVAWGGLHGIFIMATHILRTGERSSSAFGAFLGWVATFLGVLFAWILFRAQTFGDAAVFFKGLWGQDGQAIPVPALAVLLMIAVVADHAYGWLSEQEDWSLDRIPRPALAAGVAALVVFAYHAFPATATPFIYFQF
jgi:alginate O-acetyltransferase complex protein AlgI